MSFAHSFKKNKNQMGKGSVLKPNEVVRRFH